MYDITQHPFFKRTIALLVLAQSVLLSVKVLFFHAETLGRTCLFIGASKNIARGHIRSESMFFKKIKIHSHVLMREREEGLDVSDGCRQRPVCCLSYSGTWRTQ